MGLASTVSGIGPRIAATLLHVARPLKPSNDHFKEAVRRVWGVYIGLAKVLEPALRLKLGRSPSPAHPITNGPFTPHAPASGSHVAP